METAKPSNCRLGGAQRGAVSSVQVNAGIILNGLARGFVFLVTSFFTIAVLSKITALVKSSNAPIDNFGHDDYVLGALISERSLLCFAAGLELLLAISLFLRRNRRFALLQFLWLCSLISTYRLAAIILSAPASCKCLGGLLDSTIGLSAKAQRRLLDSLLLFFIATTLALLGLFRTLEKRPIHFRCFPFALLVFSLWFGTSSGGVARAEVIAIEGRLTPITVGNQPASSQDPHLEFPFTLRRDVRGSYVITFVSTDTVANKVFDCIWAYDQTNTILLRTLRVPGSELATVTSGPPRFLHIRPSPLPLFDLDAREGWPWIWLLFAADPLWSGDYTNQRPSLFEVPRKIEDFGYKWRWSAFTPTELAPDLLEIIRDTSLDKPLDDEILNREVMFPISIEWVQDARRFYNRRKRISNTFCRTTVRVNQRKSLNGYSVPSDANIIINNPANTNSAFFEYHIEASQILPESGELEMPLFPPGKLLVFDERFRQVTTEHAIDHLSYVVTNMTTIPSLDTPWIARLGGLSLISARRQSLALMWAGRDFFLITLVLLLLVGPLTALQWRLRQKAKPNHGLFNTS